MAYLIQPGGVNFIYVEDYFPYSLIDLSKTVRLHVAVGGSDNNTGIDRTTSPLATIDRALELFSKMIWKSGDPGAAIISLGAGTFTIPYRFRGYLWPAVSSACFDSIGIISEDDVNTTDCFLNFPNGTDPGPGYPAAHGIRQIAPNSSNNVYIGYVTILNPDGTEHQVNCTGNTYLTLDNIIFKPSNCQAGFTFPLLTIVKTLDRSKVNIISPTFDFSLGGVPNSLIQARGGSHISIQGTSTIVGNPALGEGVLRVDGGSRIHDLSTWTGTATGPRFTDAGGGNVLALPGGSQAGLPGSTNGTLKTGSVLASSN